MPPGFWWECGYADLFSTALMLFFLFLRSDRATGRVTFEVSRDIAPVGWLLKSWLENCLKLKLGRSYRWYYTRSLNIFSVVRLFVLKGQFITEMICSHLSFKVFLMSTNCLRFKLLFLYTISWFMIECSSFFRRLSSWEAIAGNDGDSLRECFESVDVFMSSNDCSR